MINPNAELVKETCANCGKACEILVIPLCDECCDRIRTGEKLENWPRSEWASTRRPVDASGSL